MPDAARAKPGNAGCPRCGAAFHCGAHEASCACDHVELGAATLAALRVAYVGCLCMACLREFAAAGDRAAAISDAIARPARAGRRLP